MPRLHECSLAALAASLTFVPVSSVWAQDAAQPRQADLQQAEPDPVPEPTGDDDIVYENDILVIANIASGLRVPEEPVITLDADDIKAYGASSLEDLIVALGPQVTGSRGRGGGGRPIFLVNSVRVSSFRELRSYPPEAVERIEVLPEEVAQRYGYPADQRVVNIILVDGYSSTAVEVEFEGPWEGGYQRGEGEVTYLRIDGPSRLNINAEVATRSMLTEAERDVEQASPPTFASDPDPAFYRSLVSAQDDYELTANWATQLGEGGTTLSLNATFEKQDTESLQGLDSVLLVNGVGNSALRTFNAEDPLRSFSTNDTFSLGATLNSPVGDWQLTGTLDASRAESERRIDRRADTTALRAAALGGTLALDAPIPAQPDLGFDTSISTNDSVNALATMQGTPFYLPAGDVSVTFDAGYSFDRIESTDTRNPGLVTELDRGDLSAGVNIGVPIASVRDDHWAALGDVALNLSAGVNELSDFGTLTDWSVGLVWSPTETLTFTATRFGADAAPGLSQLGAPTVVTPNVTVYDFATGQTVLVDATTGGNPLLPKQKQRDWKFGVSWQLPVLEGSVLSVEYADNSSYNVASSLPLLTPDIEAAFPGRATRDGAGNLTAVDYRPVTFARQDSRRIVTNISLNGPFGKARPEEAQGGPGGPGAGAPGGGGERRGGAPGAGGGGMGAMMADPAARERFMAFREKLCADDGIEYLQQVIAAAERGEAPEGLEAPPEQLAGMLARFRGPDGTIDMERLAGFRERVCSMDMAGAGGPPAGGASGGGGSGRRGGGFGPMGGGDDGRGRWFANLTHNWELANTVQIAPGVPELDLLEGDAIGSAQPRHTVNLRGGIFYQGFGFRLDGTYVGASRIDGSGLPGSQDLFFGDYAKFDVRVFIDLDQQESLVSAVPFLEDARFSVLMNNVFDARQTVTDGNGVVPISYQPYLVDPVGRYVGVEFRKLF